MSDNFNTIDQKPISPSIPDSTVPPQAGSLSKEVLRIDAIPAEAKPAGPEITHNIDSELRKIWVEEIAVKPDLTAEHRQLGVSHVGSDVPVAPMSSKTIQYPMSEEEIAKRLRTGQDDDSGKNLARLMGRIIKWAHKAE